MVTPTNRPTARVNVVQSVLGLGCTGCDVDNVLKSIFAPKTLPRGKNDFFFAASLPVPPSRPRVPASSPHRLRSIQVDSDTSLTFQATKTTVSTMVYLTFNLNTMNKMTNTTNTINMTNLDKVTSMTYTTMDSKNFSTSITNAGRCSAWLARPRS